MDTKGMNKLLKEIDVLLAKHEGLTKSINDKKKIKIT